jgi:GGDEF domain-containing protein
MDDDLTQLSDDDLDARIAQATSAVAEAPLPKSGTAGQLSDEELDNAISGYRARQGRLLSESRRHVEENTTTSGGNLALAAVADIPKTFMHSAAQKRIEEGTATGEDYGVVANVDVERQRRQGLESTWPGFIGSRLMQLPGQVAGLAVGGPAGAAVKGTGLAATLGRGALQAAASPTMWAEQAIRLNAEAGRDPLDIRGFPVPVLQSAIQGAVISQAGKLADKAFPGSGVGQAVGRVAVGGAVGTAEQAAADPLTGLANEAVRQVFPEWAARKSHYGAIGTFFEEGAEPALKELAGQFIFMAAASAAHGKPEQGKLVLDAFATRLDENARQYEAKASQEYQRQGYSRKAADEKARNDRGARAATAQKAAADLAAEYLGVKPGASPDDIRAAYGAKLKQHHPDRGGDPGEFLKAKWAYEFLTGQNKGAPPSPSSPSPEPPPPPKGPGVTPTAENAPESSVPRPGPETTQSPSEVIQEPPRPQIAKPPAEIGPLATEQAPSGVQKPSVERRTANRPPKATWDAIKAENPDWTPEQIGREAARRADELKTDKLTGFGNGQVGTARDDATSGAIAHVEQTGEPAVYAEIDLRNLGGLNATAGHQGANEHYRAFADIIRGELEPLGADLFRHGGDEMSAVLTGVPQAEVDAALARAQAKIAAYASEKGLSEIPHPKRAGEKGTGIHFGTATMEPGEKPADVYKRADRVVESRKKGTDVERAKTQAPEPPQPEPGGVVEGTQPPGEGGPGGAVAQPGEVGQGSPAPGPQGPPKPSEAARRVEGPAKPTESKDSVEIDALRQQFLDPKGEPVFLGDVLKAAKATVSQSSDLERFLAGDTLDEIGKRRGVTRQAIAANLAKLADKLGSGSSLHELLKSTSAPEGKTTSIEDGLRIVAPEVVSDNRHIGVMEDLDAQFDRLLKEKAKLKKTGEWTPEAEASFNERKRRLIERSEEAQKDAGVREVETREVNSADASGGKEIEVASIPEPIREAVQDFVKAGQTWHAQNFLQELADFDPDHASQLYKDLRVPKTPVKPPVGESSGLAATHREHGRKVFTSRGQGQYAPFIEKTYRQQKLDAETGEAGGFFADLASRLETEATQELKDLGLQAGFNPQLFVTAAKWLAAQIMKGGYTFAQWAKQAVQQFGPSIRPFLQGIWSRAAGMVPPVNPVRNKRLPPLQKYSEQKQIASEPRGLAKLPGGGLLDPRARAVEPYQRSIIGYEHSKGVGMGHANRVRAELRSEFGKDAFTWNGPTVMVRGQRMTVSNVMEAALDYLHGKGPMPPLSNEQWKFATQWDGILREAKANALAEGRPWETADGTPLSDEYFPHTSVESASGQKGIGYSTAGRFFAKESDGLRAGVKYLENAIDRVHQFVQQEYQQSAEHRIANDPDLGALSPGQWFLQEEAKHQAYLNTLGPAERVRFIDRLKHEAESLPFSKDQPGTLRKAFAGTIYPKEVASALVKHFGQKPYGWLQKAESVNDALKTVLGFDLAVTQLQLSTIAFRHPKAWAKANAAQFIRLFTGGGGLESYLADPANRGAASLFVQAGGTLGEAPDITPKNPVAAVPVLGKVYSHMESTVAAAFDVAKLEAWKGFLAGNPPLERWAARAEELESLMGHGRSRTIGVGRGQRVLEKLAVIAPSYYRSGLNQLGYLLADPIGSKSRIETVKTLGSFAAGITALSVAGMIAAGLNKDQIEDRLNPTNSKFMMAPVSLPDGTKQEVGIGGLQRAFVHMAGETYEWLTKGLPVDRTEGNPFIKFFRLREGFGLRLFNEIVSERDFKGNPQSMTMAVLNSLPTTVLSRVLDDGTAWQKATGGLTEFFGLRNFPESPFDAWKGKLDSKAGAKYGRRFDTLPLDEQFDIIKDNPREKTPATEAQQMRGVAWAIKRQQDFNNSLDKGTKATLDALGHVAPAHDRTLTIKGTEIPLSPAREERYKALLLDRYKELVSQWPVEEVKALEPDVRKKWMQQQLTKAKEVAKRQLIGELLEGGR